jgi:sporulation protein YlmC with PRC-barrel domain
MVMKNVMMTLMTLLMGVFVFGQTATYKGSVEDIKKGVKEGVFLFIMPAEASQDEVTKNAEYYTDYFTVNYDASAKTVKITMVDNSQMGRRVITRFLLSNGVKSIKVGNEELTLNDFFDKYLS